MSLTIEQRKLIRTAILEDFAMRQQQDSSYSQEAHSTFLDVNSAVYSRIKNGEVERVLVNKEWNRIARKLQVDITGDGWKTAKTMTFQIITEQLRLAQRQSLSSLNCDMVGIGKTHTAEQYAKSNHNVTYVKCFQGISKHELLRAIAQDLGLSPEGRISEVRERLVDYINDLTKPLIILDDAGYLNDNCWMEIKGLYDVTEYNCGWYIIGDTSLAQKINRLVGRDKLGWKAFFDRFGGKYLQLTGSFDSEAELNAALANQVKQILEVNMPGIEPDKKKEILSLCGKSARYLRRMVYKLRAA